MDLWQLNYFVKVVEEGSISAAARKLHMSQPPLSLQIKRLESELGVPLFLRDSRNMILTDAGDTLYHRAKAILNLSAIAMKEVHSIAGGTSGILRLGTTSSSGYTKVREKIQAFHLQNPGISFEVYEGDSYTLIDMLHNGELDAAFVRTPFPQKDFSCVSLNTEPLVAIGLTSFFEDPRQSVSLSWLQSRPLIIYRRWETLLRNAFNEKGLDLCPLCVSDDARTCLGWAISGLGIALIPASTLEPGLDQSLTSHPIENLDIRSSITLIMNPNEKSKIAQKFFRSFQEDSPPT
ncbi:LysR family transcriptional regulator [Cuneatibacter sp. NSJ-177]|uniref:LysR family transcriptional regulator n=1 Tax=Cuneatibacter sp. NSJ-177 TaxID=2931401 RepID=UPI001FD503AE|nr:LysR family transcriptional regulator [Cuneatibacter sp. NSJ-177]MCJ7836594.1 LysR family transcriptional regulator [Cuneatibacter sp. NSJ-177]